MYSYLTSFLQLLTQNIFNLLSRYKKKVLITDTVGFVEDMPSEIMDAFMTTLKEIEDADVILHVIDISDKIG